MRTGLSNLAIGKWIPVAFNQISPKDAEGKPIIAQAISDADRKMISDALLQKCDAKDGVTDGIISDPLGCDFDPAVLACKEGKNKSCLRPEKAAAIEKASAGQRRRAGSRFIPASFTTPASRPALPSVVFSRPAPAFSGRQPPPWKLMLKRKRSRKFDHWWTRCPPT